MHMNFIIVTMALLVSSLCIWDWSSAMSWHDSQRIGQIITIAFVVILVPLQGFQSNQFFILRERVKFFILFIVMGGVVSALLARQPVWALTEVAVMLGSLGTSWAVVLLRQRTMDGVDNIVFGAIFFVVTALCMQFLVAYFAAINSGIGLIDPWLLIRGFDNLRFFGQFSTLTLPLLAAPLLMKGGWYRYRFLAAAVLVGWWALAIVSGTRGTWLGMAIASSWLLFAGTGARRWVMVQAAAALGGFFAFQLLMVWIPDFMGLIVANHAGNRLTTSLSGREDIWWQALNMIKQKPWLGFGPMHFADIANPIAAHPHQAILQWASEWGIPSAILVIWLIWCAARAVFYRLNVQAGASDQYSVLHRCLAASMAASLAQSMVDGVLVMPYTQVWLAICSGWLFSIHQQIGNSNISPQFIGVTSSWRRAWATSLVLAAGMLAGILFRDVGQLNVKESQYAQEHGGHFQPRFWANGVIAEPKP